MMKKNRENQNIYKIAVICSVFLSCICFSQKNVFAKKSDSLMVDAQKYYWGKNVKQDFSKALWLYEQAARQGDPEAQFIAGGMYYTGKGTQPNKKRAFELLSQAAEQGKTSAEAQKALAEIYIKGEVVPQNFARAHKLFNLAANGGDGDAQNELGFMYYIGNGIEQDFNTALYWFEKAAKQGIALAQYNTGMMWFSGNADAGTDLIKAYAWLSLASSSGHQGAKSVLQYIEPMLSNEQIVESQQLSTELFNNVGRDS